MTDTEIQAGLDDAVKAGHIRRTGRDANGDTLYSITKKGIRHVERVMMPKVVIPAPVLLGLCERADNEAWRRDRVTREIRYLILREALTR